MTKLTKREWPQPQEREMTPHQRRTNNIVLLFCVIAMVALGLFLAVEGHMGSPVVPIVGR